MDGTRAELVHIAAMVEGTEILRAADAAGVEVPDYRQQAPEGPAWFRYAGGFALKVAERLAREGHRVATVNAASCYHAGGGFYTGGRHALEEAMCLETTLMKSLDAAVMMAKEQGVTVSEHAVPARPRGGGEWECHIPVDGVILSPHVEQFRGSTLDGYPFFPEPVELAAIVSMAMPNASNRIRDAPVDVPSDHQVYLDMIHLKFKALLGAVVKAGATHLVMPDAGCGVYGNDGAVVGHAFGKVLKEHFPNALLEVHLAGGKFFVEAAENSYKEDLVEEACDNYPSTSDTAERIERIFEQYDVNGDGWISLEELASVLRSIDDIWDDDKIELLMNVVDVDSDGYINFAEFASWAAKNKASVPEEGCQFGEVFPG